MILRHILQSSLEEAEHLRHTEKNKQIYKRRKETIERVFADGKEKHGLRWMKYRGLEKVATHTMLTFAAMNLKKLATWLWEGNLPLFFCSIFIKQDDKKDPEFKIRAFCLQSGNLYTYEAYINR